MDTLNYIKLSVEKLGKLLKLPKLDIKELIGQYPKNKKEWENLIIYNLRDSEISKLALEMLYKNFEALGGSQRITIASTSKSLFQNKYLDKEYYRMPEHIIKTIFKGYYGGRTEAFARGSIPELTSSTGTNKGTGYFYYDFGSLYPSCMLNELPDPNTWRQCYTDTMDYINNYEGMSEVTITIPYTEYPIIPLRFNGKLIFPYGQFRGFYTHLELRECLKNGATIQKTHHTIYFLKTCKPFKGFVKDLYKKRFEYKDKAMQQVIKIILNSLYGKFAEKTDDRDNIININNYTVDELEKFEFLEEIKSPYYRTKESLPPGAHCIPIWSAYITAYARLKLWHELKDSCPLYCDTDSLITRQDLGDSNKLGELKKEAYVSSGFIVKPKFYMINDKVKVKGVGKKLVLNDFWELLRTKKISYKKFCKFRESLRRGFDINEIIEVTKTFDLEDNKREWQEPFNHNLQFSKPLRIEIISNHLSNKKISRENHALEFGIVCQK